jgi:N-acetylglucosamine-6-sulfatase
VTPWRKGLLIEHVAASNEPFEPDYSPGFTRDHIPTYSALRTDRNLFVRYNQEEYEFYDLAIDPYELNNLAASMTDERRLQLDAALTSLEQCTGAECRVLEENIAE